MSGSDHKREVLGTGACATVYAEWDSLLRRSVAIKELDGPWAESSPFARGFLARAEQLFDLADEHVLAIYRIGDGRNAPGIVRELAEETLEASLAASPLPVERVEEILHQTLQGLQAMHDHGVVHGAVKPQNLFRCGDRFKVGDFGVAGIPGIAGIAPGTGLGAGTSELGAPGISGVPGVLPRVSHRYAAPEVLRGEAAVPASDLYSLGLIAYELLLGSAELEKLSGRELPPLQGRLPEISQGLSSLLQRMTRRSVEDRLGNAGRALASLSLGSPAERRSSAPPSPDDTRARGARLKPQAAGAKRKAPILKGALVGVAVLLCAGLTLLADRFLREQRPVESPEAARPAPPAPAPAPAPAKKLGRARQKSGTKPWSSESDSSRSAGSGRSERRPRARSSASDASGSTAETAGAAIAVSGLPGDDVALALERLGKGTSKAYAKEEKPDAALGKSLREFAKAATGVRKALRKAHGKGFSAFKDKLFRRSSPDADRRAFEAQAKDLLRLGAQIDGRVQETSMGSATMGSWKEVQRYLKQLAGSLR